MFEVALRLCGLFEQGAGRRSAAFQACNRVLGSMQQCRAAAEIDNAGFESRQDLGDSGRFMLCPPDYLFLCVEITEALCHAVICVGRSSLELGDLVFCSPEIER